MGAAMTVYVDEPVDYGSMVQGYARRHGTTWSHLMADTEDELRAFAVRLGLSLSWIQHAGSSRVHFDVTPSKREKAIKLGAQPLTLRKILELRRGAR